MESTQQAIDLKPFCCEPNDYVSDRYSLTEPFVVAGYEYATDGRIMVRRLCEQADTTGRRLPSVESYFKEIPSHAEFWPIPDRELDGECGCDNGIQQCECCGHCTPCQSCDETGKAISWIGSVAIGVRYDALLRDLPCVVVADGHDRVWFRSYDLEGVVMAKTDDEGKTPLRR